MVRDSKAMTGECRQVLLQIHYFLSRYYNTNNNNNNTNDNDNNDNNYINDTCNSNFTILLGIKM